MMFDLDGTLADTVPQLHEAVCYALEQVNHPKISIADTRNYVGNGADLLMARALTRNNDATLADVDATLLKTARMAFNEYYAIHFDCSNSLFDGVVETLTYLKQLKIKLSVVTNKPNRFVESILVSANLLKFFDFYLGSEVIDAKKPNPEPLFYVCQKLNVKPGRAVMVGDSYNDIEAAHNAQMESIALTYGYNRGRDIRDSHPSYLFSRFEQIAQLIKRIAQ